MNITRYKTFLVDAHRMNFIFFKLYTDTGLEGLGEATVEWNEKAIVAALEELGEFLIGKDPFRTDHLISTMHRNSYWRTGVVFRSALSGAEAALFDIKGKALGVPVYELLGGKHRDTVPCYGNGWFRGAKTAEDFANMARGGRDGVSWIEVGSVRQRLARDGSRRAEPHH
jgi:galactonate dehydratase